MVNQQSLVSGCDVPVRNSCSIYRLASFVPAFTAMPNFKAKLRQQSILLVINFNLIFQYISLDICRRALARQHPILYNGEKKPKSVGCKVVYILAFRGVCERTWKYYRSISRIRGNQGRNKRGEIWMSINCGSIHQGHEWFSDAVTLEEDKRFL